MLWIVGFTDLVVGSVTCGCLGLGLLLFWFV